MDIGEIVSAVLCVTLIALIAVKVQQYKNETRQEDVTLGDDYTVTQENPAVHKDA